MRVFKLLPRSLERRIALLIVVLALALTAVGTGVSILVTRAVLHSSMDEQLRATLSHPHASARALAAELPPGSVVVVHTGSTSEVAAVGPDTRVSDADRRVLEALVMGQAGRVYANLPDRDDVRARVEVAGERRTLAALSDGATEKDLARLAATEAVVWILAGLVAMIVGIAATRRLARPLREVAATTSDIAATPVDSVVDAVARRVPQGADAVEEVDAVGRSVNNLLEQVENALRRRDESETILRSFLADVSHELRTPIAVVRSHAELSRRIIARDEGAPDRLQRGRGDAGQALNAHAGSGSQQVGACPESNGEQLRTSLERIERESERMGRLVDDLLVLARLDGGQRVDVEDVDVTFIALEACSDARLLAPDHHWSFAAGDEPAVVRCDEASVRRVVTNLVANARRHTPAGTHVAVEVREVDGGVAVTVTDDGPGLPPEVAASPGRRFGNRDRSNAASSGLGLAITSALLESVGGRLTLRSGEDGLVATAWWRRDGASGARRSDEEVAEGDSCDAREE